MADSRQQIGRVWFKDNILYVGGAAVGRVVFEEGGNSLQLQITGGGSWLRNEDIINAFQAANELYNNRLPVNPQINHPTQGTLIIQDGRLVNQRGEEIKQEITDAAELSKAENLERYNTGLQQLGQLRDRTMAGLSGLGQSSRNEIMGLSEIDKAKSNQSNISRGLYNTTIPNSDINGINKRRDNSLLALNEQLRREKVGADIDLTKTMETFRAGRTDLGPNLADIASLFQQLGASGG